MSAAEKVSREEVIAHQHARLHAAQLRRLCTGRVRVAEVGEGGELAITPRVYCTRDFSRPHRSWLAFVRRVLR